TVDRRTDLTAADLAPADRDDVEKARHRFTSRSDADRFLARLQQAHEALAGTTTTTTGAAVEGPATTATTETTR
ncbi:MAG TPA: hypothetical protein VKO35_07155, partial [Acidimicrobiia bacterium]|nr:hypothetical protein [Acidimicrobiia bacterium]